MHLTVSHQKEFESKHRVGCDMQVQVRREASGQVTSPTHWRSLSPKKFKSLEKRRTLEHSIQQSISRHIAHRVWVQSASTNHLQRMWHQPCAGRGRSEGAQAWRLVRHVFVEP